MYRTGPEPGGQRTLEALENIAKHASASRVQQCLRQEDDTVQLEIRDDGVGFDSLGVSPGHLGLAAMRQRIQRLGGRFWLESSPGAGATVRAIFGKATDN